jgi:acyl carrier protein
MPERDPAEPLADDMRLANLGIDSLGIVMVFLELSTRTGLSFERREGMSPLRTVGDVVDFGRQLAGLGIGSPLPVSVPEVPAPGEFPLNAGPLKANLAIPVAGE